MNCSRRRRPAPGDCLRHRRPGLPIQQLQRFVGRYAGQPGAAQLQRPRPVDQRVPVPLWSGQHRHDTPGAIRASARSLGYPQGQQLSPEAVRNEWATRRIEITGPAPSDPGIRLSGLVQDEGPGARQQRRLGDSARSQRRRRSRENDTGLPRCSLSVSFLFHQGDPSWVSFAIGWNR
jgi:hypothetical protein